MENIFDVKSTDDLPKELSEELIINNRDDFEKRLVELFAEASDMGIDSLKIDQVTAAYYRKYVKDFEDEENKTRKQIAVKIYNMAKSHNPLIEAVKGKKGLYMLK